MRHRLGVAARRRVVAAVSLLAVSLLGSLLVLVVPPAYASAHNPPQNLTFVNSSGTLALDWDAPTPVSGETIANYAVRYRAQGTADWTDWTRTTTLATETSETVTGLTDYTIYEVEVAAVAADNDVSTYVSVVAMPAPALTVSDLEGGRATADVVGLWSDGTQLWLVDSAGDALWALTLATFDDGTLASGWDLDVGALTGADPRLDDACFDGSTMWVADTGVLSSPVPGEVLAFERSGSSWQRAESKDFDSVGPTGLWCNDSKMLLQEVDQFRSFYGFEAFRLPGRVPDSLLSFRPLTAGPARSLWSNGTVIWRTDGEGSTARVRALSIHRALLDPLDIDNATLAAAGITKPTGIWSDGTHVWISDDRPGAGADRIVKLQLPQVSTGPPAPVSAELIESGAKLKVTFSEALDTAVTPTAARFAITIGSETAVAPTSVAHTTGDNTSVTLTLAAAPGAGASVSVAYTDLTDGDDTTGVVQDAGGADAVAFSKMDAPWTPTAPTDTYGVSGDEVLTVDWEPPDNDNGSNITGYAVRYKLTTEPDTAWVDASRTGATPVEQITGLTNDRAYNVQVAAVNASGPSAWTALRATPSKDLLLYRDGPGGPWPSLYNLSSLVSDGSTLYALRYGVGANSADLVAFGLGTGVYDADESHDLGLSTGSVASGLWLTGNDLYFSIGHTLGIQVADLSDVGSNGITQKRQSAISTQDLRNAGISTIGGLWSDGTTMWVSSTSDRSVRAFSLSTGARDADSDLEDFGTSTSRGGGLWSDGHTMWIVEHQSSKVFAHSIHTGSPVPRRDITGVALAKGVWSNGTTIWVGSLSEITTEGDVLHEAKAFDLPPAVVPATPGNVMVSPGDESLTVTWESPGNDGGRIVDGFFVRHKRTLDSDVPASWTTSGKLTDLDSLTLTLSSLSNGTSYDVQVRAVNSVDTDGGDWSALMSATPELPPPAITVELGTVARSFKATDDRTTTTWQYIWIAGTAVCDATQNGSFTTNGVNYTEGTDVETGAARVGQKLCFRSAAGQKQGFGESPVVVAAPRVPLSLSFAISSGQLALDWIPPRPTAPVTGYTVRYRVQGETDWTAWTRTTTPDTETEETVTGLTDYTIYEVEVAATNSGGPGAYASVTAMPVPVLEFADLEAPLQDALPLGLWSDGTTLWIVDNREKQVWGFDLATFDNGTRASSQDIDFGSLVTPGRNPSPQGICTTGSVAWVSNNTTSPGHRLFAFQHDGSAWQRHADLDIDTGSSSVPSGLWCDESRLLAQTGNNETHTVSQYRLPERTRDLARDISPDVTPRDLWFGDAAIWMTGTSLGLLAVSPHDGSRLNHLDIDRATLALAGIDSAFQVFGVWSDGTHVWITDNPSRIVKLELPQIADGPPLAVSAEALEAGAKLKVTFSEALDTAVTPTAARFEVTVGDAAAVAPTSVEHTTGDNTSVTLTLAAAPTPGATVYVAYTDLTAGDDTAGVVQDADGADALAFTNVFVPWTPTAPTDPYAVSGDEVLTVDWEPPADDNGSTVTDYTVRYKLTTDTTWTNASRTGDGTTRVEQITGLNNDMAYDIEVAAVNASGPSAWAALRATPSLDVLLRRPRISLNLDSINSMVSDGSTLYVLRSTSDRDNPDLLAFDLGTGLYDEDKSHDFDLGSGQNPSGVWVTGDDLYFGTRVGGRVAIQIADLRDVNARGITATRAAAITSQDLENAGISEIAGLWSDGMTMWVSTPTNRLVRAFSLSTGDRIAEKDTGASVSTSRTDRDLWSDEHTMWVVDRGTLSDGALAYSLHTGDRVPRRDITDSDVLVPTAVWSNGTTVWVTTYVAQDSNFRTIWEATAFDLPPAVVPAAPDVMVSPGNGSLTVTWESPGDDGGRKVDGFFVRHKLTSDSDVPASWTTSDKLTDLEDLSLTLSPLNIGISYDVQVRAVNNVDTDGGAWSALMSATPELPPPTVTVELGTLARSFRATDDRTTTTTWRYIWIAGTGVCDATQNANITANGTDYSEGTDVATGAANVGRKLCFRSEGSIPPPLKQGFGESPVVVAAPTAPRNLSFANSSATLALDWDAPNGPAPVTGYTVRYRVQGETDWTAWTRTTTPDTATEETITGLTDYTIYEVEVAATNSGGPGAYASVTAMPVPVLEFADLEAPLQVAAAGLWSDGTTLWLVDPVEDQVWGFDLATFDSGTRVSSQDLDFGSLVTLRGLDVPAGMCTSGSVAWVSNDRAGTDSRLFAFRRVGSSWQRDADLDIDTGSSSPPTGLWCDESRLLAQTGAGSPHTVRQYRLPERTRDLGRDISPDITPRDLWFGGAAIWMTGSVFGLRAVSPHDGSRLSHLDIDNATLALAGFERQGSGRAFGIWSDGTHIWITDNPSLGTDRIVKLQLPQIADGPPLPVSAEALEAGAKLKVTFSEALDTGVTPGAARFAITVGDAAAVAPTSVEHTTGDNTSVTLTLAAVPDAGARVYVAYTDLTAGDDTAGVVQDAGGADALAFTNVFVPWTPTAPRNPYAVSGNEVLTVDWNAPADDNGSAVTGYAVRYKLTTATTWTDASRTGDGTTRVEQITGLTNDMAYDIEVAAVNASGTGAWAALEATPSPDVLLYRDPDGTWPSLSALSSLVSDGSTLYAFKPNNRSGPDVVAFDLGTGLYDVDESHDLGVPNVANLRGAWLTGDNLWFGSRLSNRPLIQIADLNNVGSDGVTSKSAAPITSQDLENAGIVSVGGLWSDGMTMWVSSVSDRSVRAFSLLTGDREADNDINNFGTSTSQGGGLWSDGHTMWIVDGSTGNVFAHSIRTGGRVPRRDITDARAPAGVWSNGTTMWVGAIVRFDEGGDAIREAKAFDLPPAVVPAAPGGVMAAGDAMLTVTWTSPGDDGGREVDGFYVSHKLTSEPDTAWTTSDKLTDLEDLSLTISPLANATSYDVRVRASNSIGDGDWSTPMSFTPIDETPPVVTVADRSSTGTFQADDDDDETTVWRYVWIADTATCDSTTSFSGASSYTEDAEVDPAAGNHDQRLCFRSTDIAGNNGYGRSGLADRKAPSIAVSRRPFARFRVDYFQGRDLDTDTTVWHYVWIADIATGGCDSTTDFTSATPYTEGDNVNPDASNHGQRLCVRVVDIAGNVAYGRSGVAVDRQPPTVTVTAGTRAGTFKATDTDDDVDSPTQWRYVWIAANGECASLDDLVGLQSYIEGADVNPGTGNHGQRLCLLSRDESGNDGFGRSEIADREPPMVTVAAGSAPGTFKATDADDDVDSPTVWHYVWIGDTGDCDSTIDFDSAASYTEGGDVDQAADNHGQRLCFRSVDVAANPGFERSEQADREAPVVSVAAGSALGTFKASDADDDTASPTVWGYVWIGNTVLCDSDIDFGSAVSYTEGGDVDPAAGNHDQRLCFRSVDAAANVGYGRSEIADRQPPTVAVSPGVARLTRKAVDGDSTVTTWHVVRIAGTGVCDSTVTFTSDDSYSEGADLSLVTSDQGMKLCFRSVDTAGNSGYGPSVLLNLMAPEIQLAVDTAAATISATDDDDNATDWVYVWIAGTAVCDADTDFMSATDYTEDATVSYGSGDEGNRLCFRSNNNSNEKGYAATTPVDLTAPVVTVAAGNSAGTFAATDADTDDTTWHYVWIAHTAACGSGTDFAAAQSYNEGDDADPAAANHGMRGCFRSVDGWDNSGFGRSDRVDRDPPTVTVGARSASGTFRAGDDETADTTWHYVWVAEGADCNSGTSFIDQTAYTEDADVDPGTGNHGQHLCFRSTDISGNDGFGLSGIADRQPPAITIATGSVLGTFNAVDADDTTTTWRRVWIGSTADCDSNTDFASSLSYTEDTDIDPTVGNHDQRLCFRSGDIAGNDGYGVSELADRVAPIVTVAAGAGAGNFKATDDDDDTTDPTVWHYVWGANNVDCDADTSFTGQTAYTEDADVDPAASNHRQRLCFRSVDEAGNVGFGRSLRADARAPTVTVSPGTARLTRKAVDQELSPTTWHVARIADTAMCDSTTDFASATEYLEGTDETLELSDQGMRLCFRSVDTSGNVGYGRSGVLNLLAPDIVVVTDTTARTISATDDDPDPTTWHRVWIAGDSTCDGNTSFTGAATYTEGTTVGYSSARDTQRLCLRSVNESSNSGYGASDPLDLTAPAVRIIPGSEPGTFAAQDTDTTDTTWHYVWITRNAGCGSGTDFASAQSYTENADIDPVAANHGMRVCFRSVDASANAGFGRSDRADREPPTVTVSAGAARLTRKAVDDDPVRTTWHVVRIAGNGTCDSTTSFASDDTYSEGTDETLVTTDQDRRLCFRSVDAAGNSGYSRSRVLNLQAPNIAVADDTTARTLTATDDDPVATTWHYVWIAGDATCDGNTEFTGEVSYTEAATVRYSSSRDTQRLCFRSVNESFEAGYGASDPVDFTPPAVRVPPVYRSNAFTASDDDTAPTTWHYTWIAAAASCGRNTSFSSSTYSEGAQVAAAESNHGQRLCFRSVDASGNAGYGRSATVVHTPAGVTLESASLTVYEGTSRSYTVVLDRKPTQTVTVGLVSVGDAQVQPTALTFGVDDWDDPQSVTVAPSDDADTDDETITITHTASSTDPDYAGKTAEMVVDVVDSDAPGLVVSVYSMSITEGSNNNQYTIKPQTAPTGTVRVTVASNNADVTVSPAVLTFTSQDWDVAQLVTVTAAADDDTVDDYATLTHTVRGYSGVTNAGSVSVTVADNTPGPEITPTTLTVPPGTTNIYTISLNTAPTSNVTVTIDTPSHHTGITTAPTSVVFTPQDWNLPKIVAVTAAPGAARTTTITHTATNYPGADTPAQLTVTLSATRPSSSSTSATGPSNNAGSSSGGGGGGGDLDVGVATVVLANGWSPPDVGVASVLAARTPGAVVVYTAGGELSESARELIRDASPAQLIVVGGTAAVTRDVLTAARSASPQTPIERITGTDRIATSVAAARRTLGDPRNAAGTTVVVANGWSAPDIGAAAALAARTPRSAVLYTGPGELAGAAAALLRDYQPSRVIIIGGTAALSTDVETAITAAVPDTTLQRIAGTDRIDTAATTARRILGNPAAAPDGVTLIIANGWSPPDIGVAAALAAATDNSAAAYTQPNTLPAGTAALVRDYRVTRVIIIGGTTAVANVVRNAIKAVAPDVAIRRITGPDRTHTAANAARYTLANAS